MTISHFNELLAHAEDEQYAIGYYESWNLESLMAVADAAEETRSPVLLGFSGIYLDHPKRVRKENLNVYPSMGLEVAQQISVPTTLVFNESPHYELVLQAIDQGFGLVMFSDENQSVRDQTIATRQIVEAAHRVGVAVEGELEPLPGLTGNQLDGQLDARLTNVDAAREFVEQTGVDALAVNIGQMHLHGKQTKRLRLELLKELHDSLDVPLVLHGATSISRGDLIEAVNGGIRKINFGSVLKRTFFERIRQVSKSAGDAYNPYTIIGSGLTEDVLMAGRIAMQEKVEDYMHLIRSAGKAKSHS
jgi:ketose-bisphosphate aldolase